MSNRIAAIQMTSQADLAYNIKQTKFLIQEAMRCKPQLIVLPEMFATLGFSDSEVMHYSEQIDQGTIQSLLAQQAAQYNVWLVGGTIPIKSTKTNKFYSACLVYNENGERVARYDKTHLFDAKISSDNQVYRESNSTEAGTNSIVIDSPVGKLGLAVCYDIRFPEQFQQMKQQGAEIFIIPSAFTLSTGKAHWELLMRARAVDNFAYTIGACQVGQHNQTRHTYGHSMIVDPWGNIISEHEVSTGFIYADIDLDHLTTVRETFS